MSKVDSHISNLKNLIRSVIKENPSRENLIFLINLCYKTATAYLKIKKKNENYFLNRSEFTIKEIACNAIIDLFERNEDGIFINLTGYFYKNDYIKRTEEESWILLRQLTFSIVNQHLYRLNNIYESSLNKIINEIKLHLTNDPRLALSKSLGNVFIYLKDYNFPDNKFCEMLPEFIEYEFTSRIENAASVQEMLNTLGIILSEKENYRKVIPLSETAVIVRKLLIVNHIIKSQNNNSEYISESELELFINESIKNIEQKIQSYISKGKLDHILALKYHKTLEAILHRNFSKNGNEESYFKIIKNYLPELTKEVYLKDHKEIIVYLAKIAKDKLRSLIKKEATSPINT